MPTYSVLIWGEEGTVHTKKVGGVQSNLDAKSPKGNDHLWGEWRRAMELEKQRKDSLRVWMEEDQEVVRRNCKVFSCLWFQSPIRFK